MPGLRFAIGAVLAIALLLVAVLGLAATVQMAHRRSTTADDPWRTLTYPDPTDWGLLADRSRPTTMAKAEIPEAPEVPQAGVTVTPPTPETIAANNAPAPREDAAPQTVEAAEGAAPPTLGPPPATVAAAPLTVSTEPTAAAEPASTTTEQPIDVVAAIPETKAAQVQTGQVQTGQIQAAPVQPVETSPAIEIPHHDDEPLEPSERVGMLPGFPTAGHGFVPPEHPIALPVPLPASKPDIKKPPKKKVARTRPRHLWGPPPFANTGYPRFGFHKYGLDYWTNYDKKWSVE
jgi:hypothetical protein